MRPRVLLSNPFAKGSTANLEEADAQGKKSALDRRMELARAWSAINKPEPQAGQVWVIAAREVVVTELITHYNTPDRLQLPEPRLRWRSRPKGKTGVESISIFTQRYSPAWLPGDSPLTEQLDEEQLDETVQQLRQYLNGDHQVLDHGTIGLFRVYSVVEYPLGETTMIPVRNMHRIHGAKAKDFLKRIHTVADYNKNRDGDSEQVVYLTDLPAHPGTLAAVRKNIAAASDAITGLGIPRQRDVLILRDLSKHTNQITGGGVGGYAYRRTHAIEADREYMATANGVDLLVHEWGHKKFFNLPQHVTKFVREWFEENVAGHAESKYAPLIAPSFQTQVVIAAWAAFNEAWKKWEGIYPEQYAQLKKRAKETKHGDDSPLLDVFLAPSMSAVGKLTKGVKNEREGDEKSLRKGTRVWVVSARAIIPDGYAMIPLKGDSPSGKDAIYVSRDVVYASLELDAEASAKKNNTNLGTITYRLHTLQLPDEPGEEREDNYFTRESSMSSFLDDAVSAAADRVRKKYPHAPTMSLMPPNVRSIFVDEWIAQVRREGDRFDPKAAFEKLFKSNADWSLGVTIDPATRLTTPYGTDVRDALAKLGITPSSYAASNVDELWAELIATAALNPSKVPKPLKAMLRDAIQGKTPGPGQRVKQDNTPERFRKAASEAFALLDASPFLDEMDKHGNKRSHASRVRAYKKSGRMVAQTFSTPNAIGGSNLGDIKVEGDRAARLWFTTRQSPGAQPPKNPYEMGSADYKAWQFGWDRVAADASESTMNEAEGAYLLHPDYVLLRITSHRQNDKLRSAFGDEGLSVMAWKPGQSFLMDRVEAIVVPRKLADKMGKEQKYPWWNLKAPKLGKGYVLNPWMFGNEGQDHHGWLKRRGFKRDDAEPVAEAVVLLDRSPFA